MVKHYISLKLNSLQMKKSVMVLGVAALFAGTTSCKKSYICAWTIGTTEVSARTITDTKNNARTLCGADDSYILGVFQDCEIK
jgi:hypothetical protein